MLSRWFRTWLPGLLRPTLGMLFRLGVTPNGLTLAGLAACALTGWLAAVGQLGWAALALVASGIFDSLDGELARQFGLESRLGPFVDSISDHYGDFLIYLGILWLGLQRADRAVVILCFCTLFGTVVGSHIRARAAMLSVDTRWAGAFTRMERTLLLLFGFLTGWLALALGFLALAANLSAAQRVYKVLNTIKE